MRKHRIIQSAVAAAACLALIFGIGYNVIQKQKLLNRKKYRPQPAQIPLL